MVHHMRLQRTSVLTPSMVTPLKGLTIFPGQFEVFLFKILTLGRLTQRKKVILEKLVSISRKIECEIRLLPYSQQAHKRFF